MIDANNPDAKALAKAVSAASEKLGAQGTAQLLEAQLQELRRSGSDGQYPRVLYGKEGTSRTVVSKTEEEEAGGEWKREPDDNHRKVPSAGAVVATQEEMSRELARRQSAESLNQADSRNAGAGLPEQISSDVTTVNRPLENPGSPINNMTMPDAAPAAGPDVPPPPMTAKATPPLSSTVTLKKGA